MVEQRVRNVFADVFQCDPSQLADTSSPATIDGWDSFGHLALVEALQSEFKVTFEIDDIAQMETLGHIRRLLNERGARP